MPEPFDLKVHHIDPKTGRIHRIDPYRLFIDKEHGRRFERPPGSRTFYSEGGELLDSPELQAKREAEAKKQAEATQPQVQGASSRGPLVKGPDQLGAK